MTGPGGFSADSQEAFAGIDGKLLYSAAAVVIVILLLTYRSPVLWLLPLLSAGVALFAAQAVIYVLATQANLTVNAQSAGILTVLVFGAGTDYALLLIARYREELRRHEDRHEAMAFALHRSGPAIIASGSTVVAGMLCLLFASMNSTRGLGPVAAVGIVIALVAMLTLLPALLVICGRWVFWPLRPTYGSDDHTETSVWGRIGRRIAVRPRLTWIVTSVILAIAALGTLTLNANGLSNEESFVGTPDSVVGEKVVAAHFPAGAGNPLVVVSKADKATEVRTAMSSTQGIAAVAEPRVGGGLAYLEGTMTDAADSQAAKDTVDRVRASVHAVPGADALVGGGAAILLDTQRAADHDNKVIIPIVLLVVLAILALLLRALVAPLMLVATVVLSFGAALGISSLVFKALGFEGADTSLPLFVFVFLVALGIDYNIFLMTRVHEESKAHGTRRGALIGVAATGGVITSAGLVLAGNVRGAGDAAGGRVRGDRDRGRARRTARHHHRPLRAGHGPEPRHRPAPVVAEPVGPQARSRAGRQRARGDRDGTHRHLGGERVSVRWVGVGGGPRRRAKRSWRVRRRPEPRRPCGRRAPGRPGSRPRSVHRRYRDGDPSGPRTPSVSCLPVVVLRWRSPAALLRRLLAVRRSLLRLTGRLSLARLLSPATLTLLRRLPLLSRRLLSLRTPLPLPRLALLRLRLSRVLRLSRLPRIRRLPRSRLTLTRLARPRLTAVLPG